MTERNYKNWLKAYIEWTKMSESPTAFHFWTGVSTIAAVLQRKVWIDQRVFQWTPNFYIVFVGPPGVVAKSTTIRLGTQLLRQVDGVNFGPNSLTWQSLATSLEEASRAIALDPDKGIEGELYHMACVTCAIGELGTFLDPADRKMVDVFTDLWDGQIGTWEHSTKTQGSTLIQNPWLNIIAATTPSWLKANFPEEMVGGGLASRIIFIYGEQKRRLVPYPSALQTSEEHTQMEEKLVEDLKIINEIQGEYKLTDEAMAWGGAWYEKHWKEKPEHMTSDRFEGYLARKQTHLHKIAIVVAASKRNERFITVTDLKESEYLLRGAERDMLKVFESIGASEENKHVKKLINYVITLGGRVEVNKLFEHVHISMSNKEFGEALEAAIKMNYLTQYSTGGIMWIRLTDLYQKKLIEAQEQLKAENGGG